MMLAGKVTLDGSEGSKGSYTLESQAWILARNYNFSICGLGRRVPRANINVRRFQKDHATGVRDTYLSRNNPFRTYHAPEVRLPNESKMTHGVPLLTISVRSL